MNLDWRQANSLIDTAQQTSNMSSVSCDRYLRRKASIGRKPAQLCGVREVALNPRSLVDIGDRAIRKCGSDSVSQGEFALECCQKNVGFSVEAAIVHRIHETVHSEIYR